jgi:hypothetical protein
MTKHGRKLYTIVYVLSYGPGNYSPPVSFYDRILARHAEEARWHSYQRVEARETQAGTYDADNDWLTVAATLRGRHTCDED